MFALGACVSYSMKARRRGWALVSLTVVALNAPAWALTIASPRPGERVMPGQTVWLIVHPSAPEEMDMRAIQVFAPGAEGCQSVQPTIPIQCALTIPDGVDKTPLPTAVDIRIVAAFGNGTEGRAATQVTIAAATEPLVALRGDAREQPLVFDYIGQEKNLTVSGESADGARHDLRGSSRGTRYEVSDPAVIEVRGDGRVVAQGVGAATIMVRHGSLFFEVPVTVRGASRPPVKESGRALRRPRP